MTDTKELEKRAWNAVRQLRVDKLRDGNPFMINSRELPSDQCYLEYPNGRIWLVTVSSPSRDFVVIRELSNFESSQLRTKFKLEPVTFGA